MALNVPQIQPSGYTEATNIVTEKFTQSQDYADTAFTNTMNFINDMKQIIDNFNDIVFDERLDSVELDPSVNLDELLRSAPINPIKDKDYDDIQPPNNLFEFNEDPYLSTLLDAYKAKLLDIVNNGGTGLGATVENDMFTREDERNVLVNQQAKDNIASDMAERGFPLPGGGMFRDSAQVDIDYQNKKLDKSRAIAEETRKIAIGTTRLAWQQIGLLETSLMDYIGSQWERKLQAAKALLTEGLSIFNATVLKLKTKADVYATVTRGYEAEAGAVTKVGDVQVATIRGKIQYVVEKANLAIAQLNSDLKQLELKYGVAVETTKASTQIAAQLAASALSAVSASAQIDSKVQQSITGGVHASERWNHDIKSEE